jgi:hypothetical protein
MVASYYDLGTTPCAWRSDGQERYHVLALQWRSNPPPVALYGVQSVWRANTTQV